MHFLFSCLSNQLVTDPQILTHNIYARLEIRELLTIAKVLIKDNFEAKEK